MQIFTLTIRVVCIFEPSVSGSFFFKLKNIIL